MNYNVTVISKNSYGHVAICNDCKRYHVAFNNLFFVMTSSEFKTFKKYIHNIDIDYWEDLYSCQVLKRKIPIPSAQENLMLVFNKEELYALKKLITKKDKPFKKLKPFDIDYTLFTN